MYTLNVPVVLPLLKIYKYATDRTHKQGKSKIANGRTNTKCWKFWK